MSVFRATPFRPGTVCPYCSRPITAGSESRDHILPRVRGGVLGGPLGNGKRWVHLACNNLREHAGECVGALACAIAVSDTLTLPVWTKRVRRVLKAWRLKEPGRLVRTYRGAVEVAAMRAAYLGLPLEFNLKTLPYALAAAQLVRPRAGPVRRERSLS